MVLSTQLAWDTDNSDEKKYWVILASILVTVIVFSWLVASTLLKEKAPTTRAEIPERFVKLVLEQQKKIVTPPPPKVVEEVKPEPEKPEPKKVEEKPKEIIQPKKQEVAEVKPQGNREDAREKAKKNLAVFDVFADLRDAPSSKKIASSKMSADVGKAKAVTRDMIVNQSKKGSGGVKVAKASSNLGGTGLEGGGSRQVSSNLAAAKDKQSRASSGGKGSQRPSENIEQFMDRYKSSFFTLYNRALRKNPSMRGEVIFNLEILPNGSVKKVSIVSSELNDPKLERKLLAQIRSINFTAMNVITWNDNYRISFIPS